MKMRLANACIIAAAAFAAGCATGAKGQGAPTAAAAQKPAANIEACNVREFGAVGDGKTKDTAAFQRALDTCAVSGGGDVLVPAGNYLIGSIQLGAATTLRLAPGAILTGSPDAEDYPSVEVRWEGRWQPGRAALIRASDADKVGIIGPGEIHGNDEMAAPQNPRGSVILEFARCKGVTWEGFKVLQGGNWATHPVLCEDVMIRNLSITGRRDGIDVDSCRNVVIDGCVLKNGDDCVSLKSGRGLNGARIGKPVENVEIKNTVMEGGRFACVGIGSETSGGVKNISIHDCVMTARTHAIYIKTRIGRAGVNENISVRDCEVKGGGFLRVNLTRGGNTNTADDPVQPTKDNPLLGYPSARNLSFKNITLTGAENSVTANEVAKEMPIDGLMLENIHGTAKKGMEIRHAKNVVIKDVNFTGFEGPMLAIENAAGTGLEGAAQLPPQTQAQAGVAAATGAAPAAPRRILLWNGENLSNWRVFVDDKAADPAKQWSAKDGVLRLDTKARGYIVTKENYNDYKLHVEWRWAKDAPANSNSGIMVHTHGPDAIWPLSFECQLKNQNAGQVVGMGLDIPDAPMENNRKRSPRLAPPSEKPLGEWNAYDIVCKGDTIEASVNGVKQNMVGKLPDKSGAIALQMEGYPIEFQNVWLEPLGN